MAGSPGDDGTGHPPGSRDAGAETRLDALDKRLEALRAERAEKTARETRSSPELGMAFRLATEFVAGVVVGGIIGWQLDAFFGTKPIFLMVFIIIGIAAAMWNVYRVADRMHKADAASRAAPDQSERKEEPDGGG